MSIKKVRLATQAKEQLMRLKTRTGIPHWNVLCRWAFCLSLRQPTPPAPLDIPADSNWPCRFRIMRWNTDHLRGRTRREIMGPGLSRSGMRVLLT